VNLAAGERLGHFEVLAPLGQGGMGEVYRARDTRLGRTVALKVVRGAANLESHARFKEEARAIAALHHPNICTLHELLDHAGTAVLVMECLEGETLAARLSRGPLPMAEALRIGAALAGALGTAHLAGIVHRDVKPGNVMLTRHGAKLLDFGLAKLRPALGQEAETASLTAPGVLLGTVPYMAPEQLQGGPIDHRADIFALGGVLFEMVTGQRPFRGDTPAELISAILRDTPATVTPQVLDHIVRTCLSKDPADRWQSAHDIGTQLRWLSSGAADSLKPSPAWPRWWIAAAVVLLAIGGVAVWSTTRERTPSADRRSIQRSRLSITMGRGVALAARAQPSFAISPDGTRVVFVAEREGTTQLFLRRLDGFDVTPLPGTAGATVPFFSPDGEWVGFASNGRLRKVAIAGGVPIALGDAPELFGADWSDDGEIVFAPTTGSALWRVSSEGGPATAITTLAADELTHRWPQFLADGRLLFSAHGGAGGNRLVVLDRQTGSLDTVVADAEFGRQLGPGLVVFVRGRQLFAVSTDHSGHALGSPTLVEERPHLTGGGSFMSVSRNGTLVYLPEEADASRRSLVWVDRSGRRQPLSAPARMYQHPRLSPDGRRIAVGIIDGASRDLHALDIATGALMRLTSDGLANGVTTWSPNGATLLAASSRNRVPTMVRIAASGGHPIEELWPTVRSQWPGSWLRDGRTVTFMQFSPGTLGDIMVFDIDERRPRPLVGLPATQWGGRVSDDGEWLAYVSNESGNHEAFVARMEAPERRWQVSAGGAHEVVWSRTGHELFFRDGQRMLSVTVNPAADNPVGPATPLFDGPYLYEPSGPGLANYDAASDGRLLMIARDDGADEVELRVVFDWVERLLDRPAPTR
jgi:Tol biopolymer transport system component